MIAACKANDSIGLLLFFFNVASGKAFNRFTTVYNNYHLKLFTLGIVIWLRLEH